MKFKLDENLPAGAARVLADAGHDVSTALQERLGGKPDSQSPKPASKNSGP
jgi:hypothetical protein